MFKTLIIALVLGFQLSTYSAKERNPIVVMETSSGVLEIELFETKAPETVKNFLSYVNSKFYNGTIFHRVIDGFMIQGGGFTDQLKKKSTKSTIKNEAGHRIANDTGTISMARTGDPHSATAQFFINVANNSSLNHTAPTTQGYGYAVFGRVKKGMPVVNKIKKAPTRRNGPFQNLPMENILIKKAYLKK